MIVLTGAIKYHLRSLLFTQMPVFTKLVGVCVLLCHMWSTLANRIQSRWGGSIELHKPVFLGNLFKNKKGKDLIFNQIQMNLKPQWFFTQESYLSSKLAAQPQF